MKLKILMLPKWYPSQLDPAEGNYVQRHVRAISGVAEVVVLYVHSDDGIGSGRMTVVSTSEDGFPVIRVFFKRMNSGLSFLDKAINLYRYLRAQAAGYKLVKDKTGVPDLVHVHVLTRTALFALYLKWACGIKFVISEHWSGFLEGRDVFRGFFKTRLSRYLAAQAACISCVSGAQRSGMRQYGFGGRILTIPNVVDTGLFRPRSGPLGPGKKKIIHLSRLDSDPKNLPGILRAVKQLSALRSDFELHLLGDGAEAADQKKLAKDLGLSAIVFFHGYLPQPAVADMLAHSCFLLMFSNYESQSCAILEALSCGIPVVATGVGGIPEIIDASRGVLVPRQAEDDLVREIGKMLDNFEAYPAGGLREFVVKNFSTSVIAAQFLSMYTDAGAG